MLIDDTSYKFKIIYEMTQKENNLLTVSMLCEIAQVSRSGYYNWVNSEDMRIKKENKDKKDFEIILQAYQYRGYNKGARSIYMRLIHMNPPIVMNVKKNKEINEKVQLILSNQKKLILIEEWQRP